MKLRHLMTIGQLTGREQDLQPIRIVQRLFSLSTSAKDDNSSARTQSGGQKAAPDKKFRPKLIIFDKYGTLVDFHSTWSPWLTSFSYK